MGIVRTSLARIIAILVCLFCQSALAQINCSRDVKTNLTYGNTTYWANYPICSNAFWNNATEGGPWGDCSMCCTNCTENNTDNCIHCVNENKTRNVTGCGEGFQCDSYHGVKAQCRPTACAARSESNCSTIAQSCDSISRPSARTYLTAVFQWHTMPPFLGTFIWPVLNALGCGSGCGWYWFVPQVFLPHNERFGYKGLPQNVSCSETTGGLKTQSALRCGISTQAEWPGLV